MELLVAMTVAGLVAGATLAVTLSSRGLYDGDRGRVDLNQNLRIGLDLLGIDVRDAGRRLSPDFPVLELIDGTSGAPDTLVLRRNLLGDVLPLCAAIAAGATVDEVRIAWSAASPPVGCAPVRDADADGWPDNLQRWRAHRLAEGGAISIYVYNPLTRVGEFVSYDADGSTTDFLSVSSTGTWLNSYPANAQCRIYVLDERRYQLTDGMLEFIPNGDAADPTRLVDGMVDFQVRARLSDSTVVDAFASTADWRTLRAIEVTLTGQADVDGRNIRKAISSRYFPRQVLTP